MKARAKKRLGFLPFEARKSECQFTSITKDMADSLAWQGLNLRQRGLYLEFKFRYWRKVVGGELKDSNQDNITFPKSVWRKLYGNWNTFKADLDTLIQYGFIRDVSNGANKYCFEMNKYGFSDAWHSFQPPAKPKKKRNKDETQA